MHAVVVGDQIPARPYRGINDVRTCTDLGIKHTDILQSIIYTEIYDL
jgi:hypothetical protein